MAFRTWGRLLLTALGVSLLAGAGQLGVAFGFGIVRLDGSFTGGSVNQWPAQLVWAGWFAANAAVAGAVLTERLARRDGLLTGTVRPVAVAAAAALGATVVAPLCMQPARAAELISVDPVWAVAISATAGAVVGAGAATAVLIRPPVGWNMALVAAVVWLLALVSAAPALISTGQLSTVRLGVLEPSWLDPDAAQRLSVLVLPLVALLAGAATGGLARWRGHPPLVSGATGVAGPVLLAFAYLTAGPGDGVDRYQATPYYGALIAVVTGTLGSAAAALLRWPLVPARTASTAIEPTEVLRALPAGPALPSTATSTGPTSTGTTSTDVRSTAITLTGRPGDEPDPSERTAAGVRDHDPGTPLAAPVHPGGSGPATPIHWDWPAPTAAPTHAPVPTPAAPADDQTAAPTTPTTPSAPVAPSAPTAPAAATSAAPTAPAAPAAPVAPVADATPVDAPDRAATPASSSATRATARPRRPRSTPASPDITTPVPATEAIVEPAGLSGDQAPTVGDGTPESAPRPRHRAPLPDLNRAATWDAFATARRAGPPTTTGPRTAGPTDTAGTVPADSAGTVPTDSAGTVPTDSARTGPTDGAGIGGDALDGSPPSAGTEQSAGKARGRRGLFRRGKARADQDTTPTAGQTEQLPAQDEEFVDWVAGLSKPLSDNEPEQESGRRSLRSSGRHHRD